MRVPKCLSFVPEAATGRFYAEAACLGLLCGKWTGLIEAGGSEWPGAYEPSMIL